MTSLYLDYVEVVQRRLRLVLIPLVGLNVVLFGMAAFHVVQGTPDCYHNEHLRSLLGPAAGILLCVSMMTKRPLRWWLMGATWMLIVVQFSVGGYFTR